MNYDNEKLLYFYLIETKHAIGFTRVYDCCSTYIEYINESPNVHRLDFLGSLL